MRPNFHTGLVGSSLPRGIPPLGQRPKKRRGVLVHSGCSDQRSGESKPAYCSCDTHVSKKLAKHLVAAGQADYLLSSRFRNGKAEPYPTKTVIVLVLSAPEKALVVNTRLADAEIRRVDTGLKRAAKRQKQIAERRERVSKSLRYFLRTEVTGGYLGADFDPRLLDDSRLILLLTTENDTLAEKLRPAAAVNFTGLIHDWIELGFDEAGYGVYADGDTAAGRQRGTVTGGLDSVKLDKIDTEAEIKDGDSTGSGRHTKPAKPRRMKGKTIALAVHKLQFTNRSAYQFDKLR
jgi:hypothetical protein